MVNKFTFMRTYISKQDHDRSMHAATCTLSSTIKKGGGKLLGKSPLWATG